ncbi:hypothetical protein [Sphingomonas sp. NIBR02145]|uniref:hypothetical protein n=1 Tax=Sphingomonas sp. NIBR02145 TaxID=3014784 RepID=UPI0022B4EF9F|nr:hypothetical protein [Sphingomonas sp. NIBR02145]WHU01732.1 hypothetical protein O3305_16240 [Sphingomonas sp. NIBR02145]
MLPIIQFDPATMSLLYDAQLIGGLDGGGPIQQAVAAVTQGRSDEAIAILASIDDDRTFNRGLQMVSAIWHEKRHFLDFVFSNYGAFRFRQFVEMYANMPLILREGQEAGKIHVPLEIYADPVRSAVAKVENPSAHLATLASVLTRRRKMIERDRAQEQTRFGRLELGGEAQLECMAFLAQLDFVGTYFGEEGMRRFYGSLFDAGQFAAKYLSLIETAGRLGVVQGDVTAEDAITIDPSLLECILFASLQTDYFGASAPGYAATSYPAERFAAISVELTQSGKLPQPGAPPLTPEDCWELVDQACRTIFGESIEGAIARDLALFRAQTVDKMRGNIPPALETMLEDYLGLRERMLEEFREDPGKFIFSARFTSDLADRLQPNYVMAASGGDLGDPPPGYHLIMGYDHEKGTAGGQDLPYRKWWWACAPTHQAAGAAPDRLGFANPSVWYSVMDFYAPTAKLLMNGRRLRTLIGPELLFAQQRLTNDFQIEIEIYPSFAFPDETLPVEVFYYYYGTDRLKCDMSSVPLTRPEGVAINPWTLRRWPGLARHMITTLGDHDFAYFTFVRDWSPWVISSAAYDEIRPLMA